MEEIKINPRCPIKTTLELIGGKWKLLIIQRLSKGELRFSEIRRLIPEISEKMLTQELKILVDSDLIIRNNFGEVPPRVSYDLTEKGKLALPLIKAMKEFSDGYCC